MKTISKDYLKGVADERLRVLEIIGQNEEEKTKELYRIGATGWSNIDTRACVRNKLRSELREKVKV